MEIILAPNAGFCYGVKAALQKAEEISGPHKVYTYGKLIHNRHEIDRLHQKNIIEIDDVDMIGPEDPLVIRSHGVGPGFYEAYGNRMGLVDATCPSVKIAHRLAREYMELGYQVLVFGDKEHPEVKGILEWGGPKSISVFSEEDLEHVDYQKPILLLSQTTQSMDAFNHIRDLILQQTTEVVVKNTICSATRNRQSEVMELAREVDTMIIIGSPQSANSKKLYDIARNINPQTHFIESKADLKQEWYEGKNKVGITAGASTPGWIIEEVIDTMSEDKMEKEQTMAELMQEMDQPIREGDVVEGVVVQIGKEGVIVDVGLKAEGILDFDEIVGEVPKVGETILAVLVKKSNSTGQPVISMKKIADRKIREAQREAMKVLPALFESREEIKGVVSQVNKAGLVVTILDGVEGFMPASQILAYGFAKNLEKYIGKEVRVRIIDLDLKKRLPKIVLSQKAILSEEHAAGEKDFWENIEVGKVVQGTVKRITDFGAFVSLGFMDGLLHVSELSWNKRDNIAKLVNVGDEINVKVIAIDKEKNKISLSLKALEEDPWVVFANSHKVGDVLKGTVTSVVDYGAFISIGSMVEGLLHVSEISHQKVENPRDVLKVGDTLEVEILEIDDVKRKVSLSKKSLDTPPVIETKADEGKMVYNDDQENVTLGDLLAHSNSKDEE